MSLTTRAFGPTICWQIFLDWNVGGKSSGMNTIEAGFLSVVVMAVVAIIALFLYQKIGITLEGLGALLKLTGSKKPPIHDKGASSVRSGESASADGAAIPPPAPPPEPSRLPAWLTHRRLKISVSLALVLLLLGVPFWWWNRHSEVWKLVLSNHIAESWALWKQDPKTPTREIQSGATLQGLTRLLDGYADVLSRDPHRVIEVWVVDHYWQYWTTDTFNDYTRANRRFVDSGGKIHRLFILTQDDLQNPLLTAVLRNQCEKIGADIWRSDAAAIMNKTEYQVTANAFQQMPYT
jgi:hypothetical protein